MMFEISFETGGSSFTIEFDILPSCPEAGKLTHDFGERERKNMKNNDEP